MTEPILTRAESSLMVAMRGAFPGRAVEPMYMMSDRRDRWGTYVLDLAVPDVKLDVEVDQVDGAMWRDMPACAALAKRRDEGVANLGWTVLRFSDEEIRTKLPDVLAVVRKTVDGLDKRGPDR